MKNILLSFCRETRSHNVRAIAKNLGISINQYKEIETGKILITETQARQLGKLFKVNGDYLYNSALQLELLLTGKEIIKSLRERNKQLEEQLKKQGCKSHSERKNKL